MGCDTPWIECVCTGDQRRLEHTEDCAWQRKVQQERRDKEAAYQGRVAEARRAVLNFIITTPWELEQADVDQFLEFFYPGVRGRDVTHIHWLRPSTWTFNREYLRDGFRTYIKEDWERVGMTRPIPMIG